MAANIAPGMNREFTAEQWENLIPKKEWYMAIEEANDNICMDIETDIQGFDLDENVNCKAECGQCGCRQADSFSGTRCTPVKPCEKIRLCDYQSAIR